MNSEYRRLAGRCALSLGVFVASLIGLRSWSIPAAETDVIVAEWPEESRLAARVMVEKYGQPNLGDDQSLTWYGLFRGRRTILHRTAANGAIFEQVVLYPVPAPKADAVSDFDGRIVVNQKDSEMSVCTDSLRTNFLVLNLAHEIASGFKTASEASAFYARQVRLADSGKSSRYRDMLIFEQPLPR